MTSKERREIRFKRRKTKRLINKEKLIQKYNDFNKVFSYDNLYNSFKKCRKGVNWKSSTQVFRFSFCKNISILYKQLHSNKYKSKGFYEFNLNERGKIRHIKSVHISERCVQKTLCDNSLVPLLTKTFIYDNSASIKDKGIDFALNRLECHLRRHFRKYGNEGYVLQFDFSNYFENIRHDKIFQILDNIYYDIQIKNLTKSFITAFGNESLGLGSQVSQILALAYSNKLDHFIKEKLLIKGYGRYMDDGYLIHYDKKYLKYCLKEIRIKCKEYGIILNERKTKIIKLSHGFTFLKTKHYITNSGKIIKKPNKKNITIMRRKIKKLFIKYKNNEIPLENINNTLQSWLGGMKRTNSYKTRQNMINLYNELSLET